MRVDILLSSLFNATRLDTQDKLTHIWHQWALRGVSLICYVALVLDLRHAFGVLNHTQSPLSLRTCIERGLQ